MSITINGWEISATVHHLTHDKTLVIEPHSTPSNELLHTLLNRNVDTLVNVGPMQFKASKSGTIHQLPNGVLKFTHCERVATDVTHRNKYQREIKPGVWVDVYDVLKAFDITCPAMAHAVKKCLAPGKRGVKDSLQDKREAITSIERSIEMEN